MSNSLNLQGLTTATREELVTFFTAAFQSIYGADINLDSDTPDGQWMNIMIQSILDLQDLTTQVYNSFDPDNAVGVVLDQRCAINGVQRQAGTFTTTDITLVLSQSVNLFGLNQDSEPIYTVADNAGNQWQLLATQTGVGPGTVVYKFQAAKPGMVLTIPNTITVPVVIVLGVTSINNPTLYSTLGINEESDMQLKIRRAQSVSISSKGYLQSLLAALENINGVTSALVVENSTGSTDGDGIPGHSIWVIIAGTPNVPLSLAWNSTTTYAYADIASSGGQNYISVQNNNLNHVVTDTDWWQVYNPIAEAIYAYRNAGCGIFNFGGPGAESYTITQIDGTPFTVYWADVVDQNLFAGFTANSLNGFNPPNITAILDYLQTNYILGVFEEVNVNQLATLVQRADSNTLVTDAGFAPSISGPFNLLTETPSLHNKRFVVLKENIVIIPIIMSCPLGVQMIVNGLVTNTTVSVVDGGTIQFTALGGHQGAMTFSMFSGTGSVNPTSGLYTASGTGTDVVQVDDDLGNSAIATVTVT